MGTLGDVWFLFSRSAVAAAVCSLFRDYGFHAEQANGPSMEPTLPTAGSLLLTWRGGKKLRESRLFGEYMHGYKRGSIVLLRSPENGSLVCKRIVGVGADTLYVVREGVAFAEGNIPFRAVETVVVPPGNVWVQGDNKRKRKKRTGGGER